MGSNKTQSFHVPYKVSKIKWMPLENDLQSTNIFATGSHQEIRENKISLYFTSIISSNKSEEDEEEEEEEEEIVLLSSIDQIGSVTDILFLNREIFLTSSENGDISIHNYDHHNKHLKTKQNLPNNHYYGKQNFTKDYKLNNPASCSGLDYNCNDCIVSVGEDGRVNFFKIDFNANSGIKNILSFAPTTSCLNDVIFTSNSSVAVINSSSELLLFDMRSAALAAGGGAYGDGGLRYNKQFNQSCTKFSIPELCSFHSIKQHPSQRHVMMVSASDGCIYTFDQRMGGSKGACGAFKGHENYVWDCLFHPTHPSTLFSSSQDHTVARWIYNDQLFDDNIKNSWFLNNNINQNNINKEVVLDTSIYGINSIDIINSKLLSASDAYRFFISQVSIL